MKVKIRRSPGLGLIFLMAATVIYGQPRLQKNGNATQLMVGGRPFLILGGELHNSSSSSAEYIKTLWAPLQQANLNTVLAGVSWELIEPKEGEFDFILVDELIKGARAHHLKLVLLWFASWKNGLSHYAPGWVKQDYKRFPRIVLENGKSTETISAFSSAAAKADAKAFAALMRHVKETDAKEQTVIMVQVQNEVGVIGATMDHSPMANAAFNTPVPQELMNGLLKNKNDLQPVFKKSWDAAGAKTTGTWKEIFGTNASAQEALMAWQYANYINQVAVAGKKEYNIPMFVNAWIVQPEDKIPGDYPSGGPQAHVHDIWRIGAPSIDILAPDIYLPDFKTIAGMYHHPWNPLFIPESFSGINGAANAFYAVGKLDGIGYSPFGIDNKAADPSKTILAKTYNILSQLSPSILAAQASANITAVSLDSINNSESIELGGYQLVVSLRKNWNGVYQTTKGYGLIIHSGADGFTVAGADIDVTFMPKTTGPAMAGLLSVEEGEYVNGNWKPGRHLNGDDIMMSYKLADEAANNRTGTGARLKAEPGILKIKLYRYE